jgi:hypothetical protein
MAKANATTRETTDSADTLRTRRTMDQITLNARTGRMKKWKAGTSFA